MTREQGSSIHHSTKGQMFNFAEQSIHTNAQEEILLSSSSNMHIKSGGEITSEAGGRNNVIGSTVHLNDGGSASDAQQAEEVEKIQAQTYIDVSNENPEFEYTENDVDENTNPLPTDGERPEPVNGNIVSILGNVTTLEPWIGHGGGPADDPATVTKDSRASENNPTNATAPTDTAPANFTDDNGQLQVGTGYDGVAGDDIKAQGIKVGPNSVPNYQPSDQISAMAPATGQGADFFKSDSCKIGDFKELCFLIGVFGEL